MGQEEVPDDSVAVRPSLPRLWLASAVAVLPVAVIAAAACPRFINNPFDLWLFVGATLVIITVAVFGSGLFIGAFFLRFRVSKEGFTSSSFFFGTVTRWGDIDKVSVGLPFAFYMAGSALRGWPFPRFVFLPRLWLVSNRDEYKRALEQYAPDGHVLRRVFLEGEKPVLREALALVLGLAAGLGLVAFFYHRQHDPLHDAASAGKMEEVAEIVRTRPELVNARDRLGRTPLHWAAQEGHARIAGQLVSRGAELDVRDRTLGAAPLHVAAGCGQHDVVKLLLKSGADPSVKDSQGRTALEMAVANGHEAIAATLREHAGR